MIKCDRCDHQPEAKHVMTFVGMKGTIKANVCDDCANRMTKSGWKKKGDIVSSLATHLPETSQVKVREKIDYSKLARENKGRQKYWGGK